MTRQALTASLVLSFVGFVLVGAPAWSQREKPNGVDPAADSAKSEQAGDDPLGFLAAARRSSKGSASKVVRTALVNANLCATTDFSHISVDAKRGIFEHETDRPNLLYTGDRLLAGDVDVREGGAEVQIDFGTPRSHTDVSSAYLYLPYPLHRHRGELFNLEYVADALAYFAAPCRSEVPSDEDG